MLGIDFSCPEIDFSTPEDGFFFWFWACFRGRGGSGRVRGLIFMLRNRFFMPGTRFFHTQDSIFMLGDAWGTPGGLVLYCFNLT